MDRYDVLSSLRIPAPDEHGRVFTLNRTGFMKIKLDPISKIFIENAKSSRPFILEVGTAYGITANQVLTNGARVVANDVDERHLILLRQRSKVEYRSRLYLDNRKFPYETVFPDSSFLSILICRVAHFLDSDAMEAALDKVYDWLIPGGKFILLL